MTSEVEEKMQKIAVSTGYTDQLRDQRRQWTKLKGWIGRREVMNMQMVMLWRWWWWWGADFEKERFWRQIEAG